MHAIWHYWVPQRTGSPLPTRRHGAKQFDQRVALNLEDDTLMLQDVLAEPAWADNLTSADRRGLTPLF